MTGAAVCAVRGGFRMFFRSVEMTVQVVAILGMLALLCVLFLAPLPN
jgi:hypothetical protein